MNIKTMQFMLKMYREYFMKLQLCLIFKNTEFYVFIFIVLCIVQINFKMYKTARNTFGHLTVFIYTFDYIL